MESLDGRTDLGLRMRVLLLTIDGLQPAYLGPYGCEWVPTPTLDRWAASGAVFDWHFANSPDPDVFRAAIVGAGLREGGVRTARVGTPLPPGHPFAAHWDIDLPAERDPNDPLALKPTRRALRQAIEQLGDAPQALLSVEIDALLPPWQPSDEALDELFVDETEDQEDEGGEAPAGELLEPWTDPLPDRIATDDDHTFARLQRTYAAAVMTLDAGLERLLGDCAKRGWGAEALWVLTSGRGYPLGEHGAVGFARADLHEELVHLPLLWRWPSADQAGLRVSALTQPIDLIPALRDLFGLQASWGLLALARGEEQHLREYAVCAWRRGKRALWGVRSAVWYLQIDEGRGDEGRRLYVKPHDRWEVNDVRQHNQEQADQMEQVLRTMVNG